MAAAFRFLRLPVQLTVLLVVAVLLLPSHAGLVVHIYLVLLAAVGLARLVQAVRTAYPPARRSAFDLALRAPARQPGRPDELVKLERQATLGVATAFDLHYRLRPTLRGIAAELLLSRRGIDLDSDTAAARRALGDDAWEIVRPDREAPTARFGEGVDRESLHAAVAALEAL
jgi:hypothetical protein